MEDNGALHVPVDIWLTTDGVLDNEGSVERVGGDSAGAAHADSLRESGWRAAAAHPLAGGGLLGWPPRNDVLQIRMTDGDIAFVNAALIRWREVTSVLLAETSLNVGVRAEQQESLSLVDQALDFWARTE